jgi:demethylmacrocin O-methyltransferase
VKTLDEIAIANGTDKATQFTRTYAKPKGYTVHYERFFAPLRDKPLKLVEIGVGGGESVRTWLEYFESGLVIGIDFVSLTNQWNTPKQWKVGDDIADRYTFMAADQTDPTFWACFAADIGRTIDIAIDDGAHTPEAVQHSFAGLWPLIKPGGLYCIEDLGCGFTSPGLPTHWEFLASYLAPLMIGGIADCDSIYISPELAIIRKTYV